MKKVALYVLIFAMVIAISGCETVPKKFREEVSGIRTRVDTLETRVEGVESKQADVERTATSAAQAVDELKASKEKEAYTATTNFTVKPRSGSSSAKTRDIQVCLKNAGYYDGPVDGIKGKKTRRAIKQFQEANGLTADGVVGPRTWEALSKYASGASYTAEGTTK